MHILPLAQINSAQAAIKKVAFMVLAVIALVCAHANASELMVQTGVVTRVVDGDTMWVLLQGRSKPLKVRLEGIDAPEICQSGGVRAQTALSHWIMGQSVTVTTRAHDGYGRTVGTVYLQGQDVARWMVGNGHAWVYVFRSKKGPYSDEFARAQTERRGVFGDTQAQEPRLFRKANGACYMSAYRPTK